MRPRTLLLVGLAASTAGCAGESQTAPVAPAAKVASQSDFESWFPLEEGKIYHYVTKEQPADGSRGETGMLVAKVHRTDTTHGELRLSNATRRIAFVADGVVYDGGGAYLLKGPIEVGVSWQGEHGGSTRIAATDVSVDVPAGHYASCIRTSEEGGRQPGVRYEVTYCPGIGMVLLVVTSPQGEGRAELKSYGLPVKIE